MTAVNRQVAAEVPPAAPTVHCKLGDAGGKHGAEVCLCGDDGAS